MTFTHAEDWTSATVACSACGITETWNDIRTPGGAPGLQSRRLRVQLERDMRGKLRERGCTHEGAP